MSRDSIPRPVSRRTLLKSSAFLSGLGVASTATGSRTDSGRLPQASQEFGCGTTVDGELTTDDDAGLLGPDYYQDSYEFSGEAGDFVSVTMTAATTDNEPDGDPFLVLLGPDGTVVGADDDSGGGLDAALTVADLPADGTYTVLATSFDSGETFAYELSLSCGAPFSPDPIACDETLVGELTAEDATGYLSAGHAHDAYAFDGTAGETVTVSMNGLDTPAGDDGDCPPPPDPFVVLLGPDLVELASDDDSGGDLNASLTTQLPEDGSYTVVATSFAPETYFTYDITLDCRAPLEPEPVDCDTTVTGELTPDDESGVRTEFGRHYHDAYVLEGTAGTDLTVTMATAAAADPCEPEPFGDPYLYLFGPDGTVLAWDDDSAGDLGAMLSYRLSTDGAYTIVATSFGADEFFPYELTVGCREGAEPPAEPTTLDCGTVLTGELAPGDAMGFRSPEHFYDAYAVTVDSETTLTLSMSSTTGDSYLYLLDEAGVLAEDDDSGGFLDSRIQQDVSSGSYTVVATSFGAGETFEYDLALQCA